MNAVEWLSIAVVLFTVISVTVILLVILFRKLKDLQEKFPKI